MRKLTKKQIIIAGMSFLTVILSLIIPSIYIGQTGKLILGFRSIFGGNIDFCGGIVNIGFCWQNFLTMLLPVIGGLIVLFFGKEQKSTYFFSFCFYVAAAVMYLLTKKFFMNINVAGGIAGFQTAETCAMPYVCMVLCSINAIACLVAIFYKPNKRLSRY